MKMFVYLKRTHPRLWCILFCAIFYLVLPLAFVYEIAVGIASELLNKIDKLLVDNLFVRIIRRECRTAKKYISSAMNDVVKEWKGHEHENERDN